MKKLLSCLLAALRLDRATLVGVAAKLVDRFGDRGGLGGRLGLVKALVIHSSLVDHRLGIGKRHTA